MNTASQPKEKLSLKVQHIGPVMKLYQELSHLKQNLIFARNGTGKSFIARALRLLDQSAITSNKHPEIPDLLVSEEAANGQGSFALFEGANCIGSFGLDTKAKTVNLSQPKYIFHVFSEDYVDEQLRNKLEELDGEISHEIIVGKENVELDEKEKELGDSQKSRDAKYQELDGEFSADKEKHKNSFGIRASLGSFRSLRLDRFFEMPPYEVNSNIPTIKNLLEQYETFKSLPSDPTLPTKLEISSVEIEEQKIRDALRKITSPSSVAEEFKEKIKSDISFFETGLARYTQNSEECPFCTQSLNDIAVTAVTAYSDYFNDKEAIERKALDRIVADLNTANSKFSKWKTDFLASKVIFDNLKGYFPSMKTVETNDLVVEIDALKEQVETLIESVREKTHDLSAVIKYPDVDLGIMIGKIIKIATTNNSLFDDLEKAVANSGEERKKIQNTSCQAFEKEFFEVNKTKIEEIKKLDELIKALAQEIASLKKTHGDTASARERVVETFSLLLKRFFGSKYSFDGATFKVRRNGKAMLRGSDRTLSDGEKSAMAFCYFLAQTHLRVESNDDYGKIYFVFDDPVTSMSFDYVYTIIQCLKLLRIGEDGEIQFNLESDLHRPKMLILTHNNYFFNVASTNNVVKSGGLFQLISGDISHDLKSQKGFATPHLLQLKDVLDVSEGNKDADHTTPNSIRSVVEGMWKFCRPDLPNFEAFVSFLIHDHQIEIKSVLINDLCHGGKFNDPPHDGEDIKKAAKEAIQVVRKFAEGQLNNL